MGTRRQEPRPHGADRSSVGRSLPGKRTRPGEEAQAGQVARSLAGAGVGERARTIEEASAVRRLDVCRVCGTEFDSSRYQVVIAALGAAPFDRIECADIAIAEHQRSQSESL